MAGMRLLLIRHGQTPSNVAGALDTAFPGAGLTPLGEVQARAIPAALAGEVIGGVHASPLTRTQQTAAPLGAARGLGVRVLDGLEEIAAGDLEMRNDDAAVEAYLGCVSGWMHGDLARVMPGGSDGHAFLARFDAAVGVALAGRDGGATVVVSHGAAIRVWTAVRTGMDPDGATKSRIMNTGMVTLEGAPGAGWDLLAWHEEPLGGVDLEDPAAHDVTGESPEEALPGS
jgi:broad specificity phosphatase PhoE